MQLEVLFADTAPQGAKPKLENHLGTVFLINKPASVFWDAELFHPVPIVIPP